MNRLWLCPTLLDRASFAAFSSVAISWCPSYRGSRILMSRNLDHVIKSDHVHVRQYMKSSLAVHPTVTRGSYLKDKKDVLVSDCNEDKKLGKGCTSSSRNTAAIFMEYNSSLTRDIILHFMTILRNNLIAGKKECECVVLTPIWLVNEEMKEFEKAGVTVLQCTPGKTSSKALQLMYKFASVSPPSTIVVVSESTFLVDFFNVFIHQYGHEVVFISTPTHDKSLLSAQDFQLLHYNDFIRAADSSLRKKIVPDSTNYLIKEEIKRSKSSNKLFSPLDMKKEIHGKEGVYQDRPSNDILVYKDCDVTTCVEVHGLPDEGTVKVFKGIDSLLKHSHIKCEIKSICGKTHKAILQFKSKELALKGVSSIGKMYLCGNKLSAHLMNETKGPEALPDEKISLKNSGQSIYKTLPQGAPPDVLQQTVCSSQQAQFIDEDLVKKRIVKLIRAQPGQRLRRSLVKSKYMMLFGEPFPSTAKYRYITKVLLSCDGVKVENDDKYNPWVYLEVETDHKRKHGSAVLRKHHEDDATKLSKDLTTDAIMQTEDHKDDNTTVQTEDHEDDNATMQTEDHEEDNATIQTEDHKDDNATVQTEDHEDDNATMQTEDHKNGDATMLTEDHENDGATKQTEGDEGDATKLTEDYKDDATKQTEDHEDDATKQTEDHKDDATQQIEDHEDDSTKQTEDHEVSKPKTFFSSFNKK